MGKPPKGGQDKPGSGGIMSAKIPGEVTLLLAEVKLGHQDALPKLLPLVYKELRRLAGHYLRDERIGHTLQPTALVHEAYLRLVDYARERGAVKRDWAMAKAWLHTELGERRLP